MNECRLQLALSKSATADINLTHVDIEIKMIEDVRCKVNSSFFNLLKCLQVTVFFTLL
jgi:hypothetical protein